jgi:hypothetical protein
MKMNDMVAGNPVIDVAAEKSVDLKKAEKIAFENNKLHKRL